MRANILKQIEQQATENGLKIIGKTVTPLKDELTYHFVRDDVINIKFKDLNSLNEEDIKEQFNKADFTNIDSAKVSKASELKSEKLNENID